MTPVLRAEKLTKRQAGLTLLSDVCFEWSGGKIVGLSGPNGAGKTTLLNAVSGFLTPDRGHCFLNSTVLTGLPPSTVARLGISRSFQAAKLVPAFDARRQVGLAFALASRAGWPQRIKSLCTREMRMPKVDSMLDRVGFAAPRDRSMASLSLGEVKQVSLACCLSADAPVLLLDEPLAGMDANATGTAVALLRDLRREGRLLVLIEHDSETIRTLADVNVHMAQGQILSSEACDGAHRAS